MSDQPVPDQPVPDWSELERLGLYEPGAPDAAERRELLEYLAAEGVTPDQMRAADEIGRLTFVASDLMIRPGVPELTLEEVSRRIGLEPGIVARLWRAAGFATAEPGVRVFSEADTEALRSFGAAVLLLGEEATMHVVRVFGTSLARMAEAAFRATLVNVDNAYGPNSESPVAAARSATQIGLMADGSGAAIDVLFRRHVGAVAHASDSLQGTGPEAATMTVGFADLVGSTGLVVDLSPTDLARAMSELDALSSEIAADHGGRIVKLIGDAVMFVTPEPGNAVALALELVATLAVHPVLPDARAAVATGLVTLRDGDYFGPVVNLAARLVHVAEPGQVVVTEVLAAELDPTSFVTSSTGTHELRGFGTPVSVWSVTRA